MDLGLGQPMEHVLRSWLIAARLGEHVGLDREQRGSLYYMATLGWVGCVADTPEVAAWFGDDIAYRGDSYFVDLAGLPMLGFMLRHAGAGKPAMHRMRLAANMVVAGSAAIERGLLSHCLTTGRMAERIGLGTDVRDPLQHFFARWDGKGVPGGVGGESIALPMRLFHLADTVEVFHRAEGPDAAVELPRRQLDLGDLPEVGGQRPHLSVFVEAATLAKQPGSPAAELEWAQTIPAETARRLACDAAITPIFRGAESNQPLAGQTTRSISGSQRKALVARDRGCRFRGCDRPPDWTDAHHIQHWADGGKHVMKNLVLLCRRHHRMVHEEGWRLAWNDQRELVAVPP